MRYSEIPRDLADRQPCKSKVGRETKSARSLSSTGGHNESYDGDGDDGYEQLSSSDGNVSQPHHHTGKALDGSIDTPLIVDDRRKPERHRDRQPLDEKHLCHKATAGSIESLNDGCTATSSFRPWHSYSKKSYSLPPNTTISDVGSIVFSCQQVSPAELAAQITLLDFPIFNAIQPEELTSCGWTKKNKHTLAPNVVAFTKRFNHTTFWTVQEILNGVSPKDRAEIISHFIKVAKKLHDINNLHSLFAVISALKSASVHRLKESWLLVSRKDQQQLDRLSLLFDESDNWAALRKCINQFKLPGIPYLGIFLTDIIYIDLMHSNKTGEESYARETKMNNVLRVLSSYQSSNYTFISPVPPTLRYLQSRRYIDELQNIFEEDQYKKSLNLEPTAGASTATSACTLRLAKPKTTEQCDNLGRNVKTTSAVAEGKDSIDSAACAMNTSQNIALTARQFIPGHRKCYSLGTKSSEQSSTSSSASSSRHARVADGLNKMRHLLDDSYVEAKRANSICATGSGGGHSSSDQETEHPTALQLVELEPITSGNLVEGYLKRKTVLKYGRKPTVASWQRYWVLIWSNKMIYFPPKTFKGNERSNFKKEPSKIFPLEGWTAEESDLPLQDEFFQLVNYNHGHAYRFKSGSHASANRWLAALKQVTTPKPAEPLSISLNLISMATETETATIHTNGGLETVSEEEGTKPRPADIEADMREMERRKRVESIMNSRLFREELERIVDGQMREGSSTILQQLSDIMGMPAARIGSVFKSSNCVVPINDIRGVESMGYEKGEKILRCKLAATFRLMDLFGWTQGIACQITARLNADQELFLVNPYGMLYHEVTASSLNKVNMQGQIVEHGTTNFGINNSQFTLHSVIHAARPDIRCAIYVAYSAVTAVSALKQGLQPLTKHTALLGEIAFHTYAGALNEPEEKDKLLRSLGPVSKVLLLSNHGALCCGETIEEAFYHVTHMVQACEAQLKLLPVGLENLILIPEETRKAIYDAARKPAVEGQDAATAQTTDNKEGQLSKAPKWRVGGSEFEALMRMLDNAGFRTGYIFRNPLIKGDIPKPRNDIEVPPAVSSLGYLIEEEELFKQGIWRKGDPRKVGDRTRWLNSPNVYQKVEVLETGTPDPKKITKWVAEPSPTHSSTPVKIEHAHQFVPTNTNPREFKRIQQQIKDNRRADKISAGPQSHILEGVSWDEANRLKDANVSAAGDHVVLMGAASKGIIQRGYQHNATVYKAPYAKNPFDSVTDDELNEYKKTVEKKRHGDGTDTDFSESEALSSLQISGPTKGASLVSPPSQSEQEDTTAEHHVLRIETKQAPKPSQPEVVLSDGEQVQNGEQSDAHMSTFSHSSKEDISTDGSPKKDKKKKKGLRTPSFLKKRKDKKRVES
uniref:Ras-GEF domain-containing protein n=1 Tax=Anopheles epiroticus TaxID=199890 RepID=A0A182P0K1_9DIPT